MLKIYTTLAARLASLRNDEKGVTALEYGVIAAVTIVVGLAAFNVVGTNLATVFADVALQLPPE
jgi:pilus assembly protein Flp/PilA